MKLLSQFRFFIILIISFLASSAIQATVGNIILLESPTGQYLYLFSDLHRDYQLGLKSKKQQSDIVHFAKQLNAHVIAEDMNNYDGQHETVKADTLENSRLHEEVASNDLLWAEPLEIINDTHFYPDFVLPNIIKQCRRKNISCFNAECRQVASRSNSKETHVSIADAVEDYYATVDHIRNDLLHLKYDAPLSDQPFFNLCLNKVAVVENENKPLMEFLQNRQQSLWEITDKDFIVTIDHKNYDTFYDLQLVDFRILIDIYKNRDRKNTFVLAGGQHINNIIFSLEKLGYRKIMASHADIIMNTSDLHQKSIIDNAPDIAQFFGHAYKQLMICSTCHIQWPHNACYTQHEARCKRKWFFKKSLLYAAAALVPWYGLCNYFGENS